MYRNIMFCLLGLIIGILIAANEIFILVIPVIIAFITLMAIFKRPVFLFATLFLIIGMITTFNSLDFSRKPINEFVGKEDISGSFYIKDILEVDNNFSLCLVTVTELNGVKLNENVQLYFYGENNPRVNNIYSFSKMKLGVYSKENIITYGKTDAFYSGNISLANSELKGKVKTSPISLIRDFRQKVGDEIDKTFSKRTRGFLRALFTGDRSKLDIVTQNDFKNSGISHILAVSGMHVVILMNILSVLTFGRKELKWIQAVFLILFIFFSGASPSVIRAAGIYFAMFTSSILKRTGEPINILFLVAFITLLFEPVVLFSKSFQLSYIACFAIIAVTPMFYAKNKNKIINYISQISSTSIAVQIMTFPIICQMNTKISFFMISANIVAITTLPFIYIVGYIGIITKIPFVITLGEYMTKLLMFNAELFSVENLKSFDIKNNFGIWVVSFLIAVFLFFWCLDRKSRVIRKEIKEN